MIVTVFADTDLAIQAVNERAFACLRGAPFCLREGQVTWSIGQR